MKPKYWWGNFINDTFSNQRVVRKSPIEWPAISPDLLPIDLFVSGHLTTETSSLFSAITINVGIRMIIMKKKLKNLKKIKFDRNRNPWK